MEILKITRFIAVFLFCIPVMLLAEIEKKQPQELESYGVVGGVVKPVRRAKLSFAQAGVLIKVPDEGQIIQKGFIVAKQDDRQAQIGMAEAEAAMESARLAIETAQHEKAKTERLLKEKIVAPIALTESNFALKKAEAQLKIAEAGYVAAKLKLKQCQLIAPFKGVIVEVMGTIGEQSGPGNPVAEIVDLSCLEISVDIPLHSTRNIKPGLKTSILIGSKKVGKAEVKVILPLVDPASGLRRVIWRVIQADEMLTGRHISLAPWK
jgi:RND family efflux transporter MFP subunit